MEERYVSCFCIELATAVAPAKRLRFNIKNTVAIKSREQGISPSYYECGPRLLSVENRGKIEPTVRKTKECAHLMRLKQGTQD